MLLRHYSWLDEFAFNYPPPMGYKHVWNLMEVGKSSEL